MTFGKIGRAAAICMAAAVSLSGCWDRREVNDIAIVSGSAIDKVGGKYRAAVQFPLAGQLGGPGGGGGGTSGEKSWYVESGTGDTLKETSEQMQRSLSRHLHTSHRRVYIIGEEMARSGIMPIVDSPIRTPQNRFSAFVVFTKGEAIDVLNANISMEKQPSEMVRELTVNSMKSPPTLKELLDILLSDGLDLAAPYFVADKSRVGDKGEAKPTITMDGLAVFKEDKLAGFLKGDGAKGVLWTMNQAVKPIITVEAPRVGGAITLQFDQSQVQLKPEINGDQVSMKVKIRAFGSIQENGSNYKTITDNMAAVQEEATKKLEGMVESGIRELQELGSDACGFGDSIYRKQPGQWKRLKGQWKDIYPKVKVTVEAVLELDHAGTILEPAGWKKERMVQ